MAFTFEFLRNTAAEWTRVSRVAKSGEPIYATDTGDFAIGDGKTPWQLLPKFITKTAAYTRAAANGLATLGADGLHDTAQSRAVSVYHGANAATARPAVGAGVFVTWQGSVAPANGTGTDVWIDTASTTVRTRNGTQWVSPAAPALYTDLATMKADGAAGKYAVGAVVVGPSA